MSKFDARVQRSNDGSLHVFITGSLDEDTDFESLFARLDTDSVLNLSGIDRLNSLGVHRWMSAIGAFSKQRKVTIEACSYVVALQAACIANLFGSASVRSTLAPYYCSSCSDNRMVLVAASEVKDGIAPAKDCPTCNSVMVFDELDNYFGFLSEGHAE